jgi:hypothetical protein
MKERRVLYFTIPELIAYFTAETAVESRGQIT